MRGKARNERQRHFEIKDHPRLCGEKQAFYKSRQWEAGSPPPMRGKVFDQIDQKQLPRITPAYAGKRCKKVRRVDLV